MEDPPKIIENKRWENSLYCLFLPLKIHKHYERRFNYREFEELNGNFFYLSHYVDT